MLNPLELNIESSKEPSLSMELIELKEFELLFSELLLPDSESDPILNCVLLLLVVVPLGDE